jgi:hypothetical protein
MLFAPRYTRTFFWINLILPTGILAFGLLFFALLKEHDYYMINALIIIPIILVSFALMLKLRWSALYRSIVFRVLLAIILVHSIDFARRRIHERYAADSWQNQSYISNKQVLRQLPEYFSAIGVKPDALVISLPDPSVDVSLYMMNHKGWTNYNINRDASKIREKIAMGAEFLIISDSTLLELPFMKPFIHNKIGQLEHISIFKIKNSP